MEKSKLVGITPLLARNNNYHTRQIANMLVKSGGRLEIRKKDRSYFRLCLFVRIESHGDAKRDTQKCSLADLRMIVVTPRVSLLSVGAIGGSM